MAENTNRGPGTDRALNSIANERWRQILAEGFSVVSDDGYTQGELAQAAACYARIAAYREAAEWARRGEDQERARTALLNHPRGRPPLNWPWPAHFWKPKTTREDLVRAAALLVAEIERIDRRAAAAGPDLTALEQKLELPSGETVPGVATFHDAPPDSGQAEENMQAALARKDIPADLIKSATRAGMAAMIAHLAAHHPGVREVLSGLSRGAGGVVSPNVGSSSREP